MELFILCVFLTGQIINNILLWKIYRFFFFFSKLFSSAAINISITIVITSSVLGRFHTEWILLTDIVGAGVWTISSDIAYTLRSDDQITADIRIIIGYQLSVNAKTV